MKIAGCIILYNPKNEVLVNIESYLSGIETLFVFDNSDIQNIDFIKKIKGFDKKIEYKSFNKNIGIASALNYCCNLAIESGYDWILTMDQDSKFNSSQDLDLLVNSINDFDYKETAIITPVHGSKINSYVETYINKNIKYESLKSTLTSGNLLNLSIFKKVGGFIDELFIDEVDGEYCLKVIVNKFKIIRVNNCIIDHNLGDQTKHNFLFREFITTNHNHIRRYYISRNRFYVCKIYKEKDKDVYKDKIFELFKQVIKIILAEKNKNKKLYYTFKGYIDYKIGKMGKLDV